MTDSTLNQFLSRGTNAQRLAFTPSPPTPASGNSPTYIFYETDTGNTYAWTGAAWAQVNGGLGSIADGDVLANISGSSAAPIANTVSAVLDHVLGSTQGDILYRGASAWAALAPGTSGNVLKTGGSSANPSWGTVALSGMANLAANSIIGNNTGSSATPLALTGTQTTAMLDAVVGDSGSGGTKGLVPAPASGDAAAGKFLKADGTWTTAGGWKFVTSATASGTATALTGLGSYTEILVIADAITTGSGGFRFFQASTDGGTTYYTTSGDYVQLNGSGTPSNQGDMGGHSSSLTTATIITHLIGNVAGHKKMYETVNQGRGLCANSGMVTNAINAIQLGCTVSMTGGTITVYGK